MFDDSFGFLVAEKIPNRSILGQNENGVRADTYVSLERHFIACSAVSGCVIAELIAKIWAVALPATIQTDPPVTSPRESQGIVAIAAVAKICNDHHIVARTAGFPAMECNHLIGVVDMMDIDVLIS